jgi:hypothetical protein
MTGGNLGSGGVTGGAIPGAIRVNGRLTLNCVTTNPPLNVSATGYDQQACPSMVDSFKDFTLSCGPQVASGTNNASPIIVDVDGSGYHLTSAENGVKFDFFDNGNPVEIAWTARGSTNAFLVRDLAGTGKITNAKEMFGNLTEQPPSSNPNGFSALAQYDQNGDGWIDAQDEKIWPKLLLWQDTNHNGVTDPGELHSLTELGITRISVNYREERQMDQFGNVFRYRAAINDASKDHRAYDVFLRFLKKPGI